MNFRSQSSSLVLYVICLLCSYELRACCNNNYYQCSFVAVHYNSLRDLLSSGMHIEIAEPLFCTRDVRSVYNDMVTHTKCKYVTLRLVDRCRLQSVSLEVLFASTGYNEYWLGCMMFTA